MAKDINYTIGSTEMTPLVTIMEQLRKKKIDNEFRWVEGGFTTTGTEKVYAPEELTIIKTYRFEGESDPGASSILYIFEANDGLIGYSLDAYGMYSSHENEAGYDDFIKEIPVVDQDERLIFAP